MNYDIEAWGKYFKNRSIEVKEYSVNYLSNINGSDKKFILKLRVSTLDRGDLYADFIGQYVGMALIMVKQLQFEEGK